ncbi:amino acid adenylation domain-containing protein (plasmid) [Streptomyces sp. BHT-5-2]|uniref:non-ribosomal peptide synthetase n=1 Tax=Streptomyces sp. BHT-5-2 TaxID=2866715 RepID=UPI001C8E14F5|nr:amino acid adenylation domain-containing protein [Streptomyces sp. BHT-5-2]QZL08993.1 amino acid adenylation domain-containing protein [Streptomyces sp. BHT-5-2]
MTDRPASPGQLRFFVLDQRDGRATVRNHLVIEGRVSALRLTEAVHALLEAQPALRTSLHMAPDGLTQRTHPASAVDVQVLESDGAETQLPALITDTGAPFAHDAGPLCRVRLLVGPERTHCLIGTHHAIFDDDSTAVLLNQLSLAYEKGAPSLALAPPTVAPDPEHTAQLREFWSRALADCPQDTALPLSSTPDSTASGVVTTEISPELATRMAALTRERGATPFAQLLAAAAMVTCWYTSRDDLVIATVASGRSATDQDVIGCLQNTVPVRLRLDGADSDEVLDRTMDALFDAVDHAALPIEDILDTVGVRRCPGRKPLTQILCAQTTESAPLALDGLSWQLTQSAPVEAEYDVALTLHHSLDGAMRLEIGHRHAALTPQAAQRLAQHLLAALEALADGSVLPLSELSLLSPEEVAGLSALDGGPAPLATAPVHAPIEEHVRRTPSAVAVTTGTESITYAELSERATALATALIEAGVSPGDRVGVCLPRTPDLVVTLLAVWKTGAAYVPLDPEYPPDRLRYMAEDAALAASVAPEPLVPGVPNLHPDATTETTPPAAWPDVRPADPAYLIYTSGSTGRPKGVVIRHENLSALFAAFDRELGGGPPPFTVAGTSLSFDISALELHWPLARGRSVLLTSHRAVTDAPVPDGALYQCTPTVARILATDPDGRRLLTRLGALLVGGEPLPADLARELTALVPGPVINCYGPTETTVWSTVWRIPEGTDVPVHIGRPLLGERCHVVDAHGRRLPVGVPGRLMVSGAGVGQGYWQQPTLTADRFCPLPDAGEELAYDTGDMAVFEADHGLRFVSRGDTQVKVRGQRIELEEIESALRSHPEVRDAAVAVVPDGTAVAAFIAPTEGIPLAGTLPEPVAPRLSANLRAHAATWLTEAMVPSSWLLVPALPQLPNGKLDRATVTSWTTAQAAARPGRAPAATPVGGPADPILNAWSEVLAKPVTDLDATFFELGGNSLGLLRVLAALRTQHPTLQVVDLFQHTTVRSLAAHLASLSGDTQPRSPSDEPQPGRGAARAQALARWKRPTR